MEIKKNIAANIQRYKLERDLTIAELAEELHLAVSTTVEYLGGRCNPRADTLELLADCMGLTAAELISSLPPDLDRTGSLIRAAQELAVLPPAKREKGVRLLLELAGLFAGEE